MEPDGMTIGARANARAQTDADAVADTAAKRVFVGAVVVVVLTVLFGFVNEAFPFLASIVYAVGSGICLAKHRTAVRSAYRFLLVPFTALLIACVPTALHSIASMWIVSGTMLTLFGLPVLIDLGMRRASPMSAGSMVVCVGAACFAVTGLGIGQSLLWILAFVVTAAAAIARCSETRRNLAGRVVFAATVGFSVAWLGLALQCTSLSGLSRAEYAQWFIDHPADDVHFQTLMIAGFPIQHVEGHGGGGAREYLPWGKGLGTLIANYLICTGAALLLSRWIPKRSLIMATSAGIVSSFLGGLTGWWHLLVMLD